MFFPHFSFHRKTKEARGLRGVFLIYMYFKNTKAEVASVLKRLYQMPQSIVHQCQDPALRLGFPLGSGTLGSALGGSSGF